MAASPASGQDTRALAFELVRGVIEHGRALDDTFETAMEKSALSPRDRAFVRRLATGTLRHFGQSEAIVARLLDKKPLRPRDTALRCLFALAVGELVFLKAPPHAAINGAVNVARAHKAIAHQSGLINAVLRRASREGVEEPPPVLNLPPWLRARWKETYGADALAGFAAAQLVEPALDLTVRGDAREWATTLGARLLPNGTLRRPLGGRIEELPGYAEGAWWVQDAAAALPPQLLQAHAGEDVLDLCAAPGGKTAALAATGARVTALDRDGSRLARLRTNLARLKLKAEVIEADLACWQPPRLYDKVLLDAPCTATGTIRRHPDVPYLKNERDIGVLATLQSTLLDAAARAVKPGGTLVYAVCSMEPEEGEVQADAFLRRHREFARAPVGPHEVPELGGFVTPLGDLRTTPAGWVQWGGLDGFFASRFARAR